MSNSPLVVYTHLSPNRSSRNGNKIDKITPHHMAGMLSVETCGNVFAPSSRQASSNYGIGGDGRVALYVPEDYRAWTSSNAANDRRAVTIEVANNSMGPDWTVSDEAWNSLIDLCVDICQRNDIPGLIWTGDSLGSITNHDFFANTNCPGPYLKGRMLLLADEVNRRLNNGYTPSTPTPTKPTTPAPSGELIVDGFAGPKTITKWQRVMGTFVDGVVSGQYPSDLARINAGGLPSSSWQTGKGGSQLIRAVQKVVGTDPDGFAGVKTIKGIQRYFNTYVDGVVSGPSAMVMELQRRLNQNRF